MQIKHFITRLNFFIGLAVLCSIAAVGQKYDYTVQEKSFWFGREQVKLITQPDGTLHLWQWGDRNVVLTIYSHQLQLLSKIKVANATLAKASFLQFDKFYYVWFSTFPKNKLYLVQGNSCVDKSADMEMLPFASYISQVAQSNKALFFIQQDFKAGSSQRPIHITAVDTYLQFIDTLSTSIKCTPFEQYNLHTSVLDDQLFLMMGTATNKGSPSMELRRINIKTREIVARTYHFSDKRFFPTQLKNFGTGYFIEGLSTKLIDTLWWRSSYGACLVELDSALNISGDYYTGSPGTKATLLPNQTLLLSGFRRGTNNEKEPAELEQFCLLLDTGFQVLHSISKPFAGNSTLVSYLLNQENEIIIFYEEEFKKGRFALHGFQLAGAEEKDQILQLQPKFRYLFTHAVRTADNTFVMPYLHRYNRIGLVRLRMKEQSTITSN